MIEKNGKIVCAGIARGPAFVLKKGVPDPVRRICPAKSREEELDRLNRAAEKAEKQIKELIPAAKTAAGEEGASVFEAYLSLLSDEEYVGAIRKRIEENSETAEYAAASVGEYYASLFSAMENEYMKARAADVRNLTDRLIRNLSGEEPKTLQIPVPSIVFAEELAPGELIRLDKSRILGLVTAHGGADSHTAILIRMMEIPSLTETGLDLEKSENGTDTLLDAGAGRIFLEPSEEAVRKAEEENRKNQEEKQQLLRMKGKESITKSGKKIRLFANIGSIQDLKAVLENDAEGVGLFRSEFLYLGRNSFPTEEEQYQVCCRALSVMKGKPVAVRTIDVGADKKEDYFCMPPEENPALGCRGIRFCFRRPEIFKTQLRALFRAAAFGELSVLYPMISSLEETERIQKMEEEVLKELQREQIPFALPRRGFMIETPAAVMISDELAKRADFLSIGTNDLTQYTLAVDRKNSMTEAFYLPHHPAVLKMIRMTVENAHAAGIPAAICGELAADETLTEQFLDMGVDELSAAPDRVLGLRKKVRELE